MWVLPGLGAGADVRERGTVALWPLMAMLRGQVWLSSSLVFWAVI